MYKRLVILFFFVPTFALAQNTGGVFGPSVNAGHKSLQYRITLDPDNSQDKTGFAQRLHYQQAINDDLMWRILGQSKKTDESNTDLDFLQAELFWQLQEKKSYQSGLRFDLKLRDEDRPDQIGVNWMHQYQMKNNWAARFVVLAAKQVGDNSADGVFMQTRGNVSKKTDYGRIGLELFNNYGNSEDFGGFDEQKHTVGPFAVLTIGDKGWSAFVGALAGLSDAAADLELRLWITKSL